MNRNRNPKLNWKLALAGGVALGAGFGALSVAGADTVDPAIDGVQLEASAGSRAGSLPSLPSLSVRSAVPAPVVTIADSAASAGPVASAPGIVSAPSITSVVSVDSAPAPAPAPEVASAPSVASPASVASIDS